MASLSMKFGTNRRKTEVTNKINIYRLNLWISNSF